MQNPLPRDRAPLGNRGLGSRGTRQPGGQGDRQRGSGVRGVPAVSHGAVELHELDQDGVWLAIWAWRPAGRRSIIIDKAYRKGARRLHSTWSFDPPT